MVIFRQDSPVHQIMLVVNGIHLLENTGVGLAAEPLRAAACAR